MYAFASSSLFLPIAMPLVAVAFLCVASMFIIRAVKQQIRLYNSITLIELKTPRLVYWVLSLIMLIPTAIIIIKMAGGVDAWVIEQLFDWDYWAIAVVQSSMLIICVSIGLVFGALALAKCALVDRGVYTKFFFYDWHHIYDYLVDETKNTVVLTDNKQGVLSLKGICAPLRFKKQDVEKLKFILNKNKNKFITDYELR